MPAAMDSARFAGLLALAGPDHALELTDRLVDDLGRVSHNLTATPDRVTVRAQSHVLLAIAGTIGATRLYHMAQGLNHRAKDPDCGSFPDRIPEVLHLLDQLIAYVRAARSQLAARP